MAGHKENSAMPVVRDAADFDRQSGNILERFIFNNRVIFLVACLIATVFLGFAATRIHVNANFERMIPLGSPYIQNYLENKKELPGLGNTIRIVVENKKGDIYDPEYLEVLRKVNDTLYLIPGVDRSWMKSLWMPIVRWREVTEDGITGGAVMPANYNGSSATVEALRANVAKAGIVGKLVSKDMRSSMIVTPMLDVNPQTGEPLNYGAFADDLEQKIRVLESDRIGIHIVGFAKVVGGNRSLSGVLSPPAPTRNNPSHFHEGGVGSDQGDSDQQQVAAP